MTMTSAAVAGSPPPGPTSRAVAAFWAMMLVVFLAAMDSTVVATVLTSITADLGSTGLLAWVITSYLLTTAVSIPLWGKAADVVSSRSLYLAAAGVFLLGSLVVAAAPTMLTLVAARAAQGLGTGGLMALTPTITGELFPARIRGRFHGRQGAVLAGASIVGPVIGGLFAATLGWRAAFWVNVPAVGAALIVAGRCLPAVTRASSTSGRRIDVVGAVLLALASSALLLALSADTPPTAGLYRTSLLLTALAAVVGYLFWQSTHSDPVLPMRVLRSPIVAGGVVLSFVTGSTMITTVVHAPLFVEAVQGHSAAMAGALLLPLTGGVLVANLVGGSLITRLGRYRPILVTGSALLTAGIALLAAVSADTGIGVLTAALALTGIGVGFTMQPAVLALQNAVADRDLGAATAASTFFRQLGSTLAVGVLGGVLTARVGPQIDALTGTGQSGDSVAAERAEVAAALGDLFTVLVPVAGVAVLVAVLLPEKPLSDAPGTTSTDERSDDELHAPA